MALQSILPVWILYGFWKWTQFRPATAPKSFYVGLAWFELSFHVYKLPAFCISENLEFVMAKNKTLCDLSVIKVIQMYEPYVIYA